MTATTVRIALVIDVPADQLAEAYGSLTVLDAADLERSLRARLDEFYPGADGYVTPSLVAATVVDTDSVCPLPDLTRDMVRGAYVVGMEGLSL